MGNRPLCCKNYNSVPSTACNDADDAFCWAIAPGFHLGSYCGEIVETGAFECGCCDLGCPLPADWEDFPGPVCPCPAKEPESAPSSEPTVTACECPSPEPTTQPTDQPTPKPGTVIALPIGI